MRITLVELSLPKRESDFIPHTAGIWKTKLTPGAAQMLGMYYGDQNAIIYERIGEIKVDNISYNKCDTYESCKAQDSSYYYDKSSTDLFIHFENFGYPVNRIITFGIICGFSVSAKMRNGRPVDAYIGNISYDPVIKSISPISKTKDALFYGRMQFNACSITFFNANGRFDTLEKDDVYGQNVRILRGEDTDSIDDFKCIYSGYIEDFSRDYDSFTLNLNDPRKSYTDTLPTRKFTKSEFPMLKEEDENRCKPLRFGKVFGAECVCINGDQALAEDGSQLSKYMFIDTFYGSPTQLLAVYSDGELVDFDDAGTAFCLNLDMSAGTFELPAYYHGSEITCDVIGYSGYSNGLAAIRKLLNIARKTAFIPENFDTDEWEAEEAKAPEISLDISDEEELSSIFERISASCYGIFYPKDDSRMSFRSFNPFRSISKYIFRDDWAAGDSGKVSFKNSEFLSSITVQYAKNQASGDFKSISNTYYEEEVYARYDQKRPKTIETILATAEAANEYAEKMLQQCKEIRPEFTRQTTIDTSDMEIMDFVIADNSRPFDASRKWQVFEIISLTKPTGGENASLTLKAVRELTQAERDQVNLRDIQLSYIKKAGVPAEKAIEIPIPDGYGNAVYGENYYAA